jgi:FAD-dependent urate hydroxylase
MGQRGWSEDAAVRRCAVKVIIVGAGIGGLTTHLVCHRAGFEVEHYERQPQLGPAGAGIVLWPNGVKILLALGLGERLKQIGHGLERVVTRTHEGLPLSEMPVGELEQRMGAPVYPVSRTDLQAMLVDALGPGALRLGATCVRVEQTSSDATAYFEDGRTATGDVIVGADGIHSVIRHAVAGEITPRYSGMANWVGIVPNDCLQPEHTGYEFLGDGRRCGLLPLAGNRLYYGFASAAEKGTAPASGRRQQLRELFGGWPAPIPDLLERFDEAELKYLEIHDLPPLPRWSQGRLTLLGDAAHATAPTLGQGGCQAMEDAILLARCLGTTTLGVADGLTRYEAKRKARAEMIVARSRQKVESLHASDASIYGELYAKIKASSVAETMRLQEALLEEGPFG